MSHAISLERNPAKSNEVSVAAIAKETDTAVDVVKVMYEEEMATLSADARIKQYVGVIATKRVRHQLRRLGHLRNLGKDFCGR